MPRASTANVPGRTPTHSCERAAVREKRVSTWTNRGRRSSPFPRPAKATNACSGDHHDSNSGAPNDSTYSDRSKS